MPQEGLLSQIDASPFAWLEDRGLILSLHGSIDDATSKIQGLHFELHECLYSYLKIIMQVTQNFGISKSIYSDLHTIFFSPKDDKLSTLEELSVENIPLTQLGIAISELGIRHIPVRTLQAKGFKVISLTPKCTIKVLTYLDGSFCALYEGKYYSLRKLLIPPKEKVKDSKIASTKKPYRPYLASYD